MKRQSIPRYGSGLSAELVKVEAVFGAGVGFLLGRTAACSPNFPGSTASQPGMIMGAGAGLSERQVRLKAFAELVERVSACRAASEVHRTRRASGKEFTRSPGVRILEPNSLKHLAGWQILPRRPRTVSADITLTWCAGRCLASGEPVWVPALAAFFGWPSAPDEPCFLRPHSVGLAAHSTAQKAIYHALLEVLERDACMRSWRVPGWPVARLEPSIVSIRLRRACQTLGLSITLYNVGPAELPPTMLAIVSRPNDEELTCGLACGPLGETTADKAVGEALMMQWTARTLGHPDRPGTPPTTFLEHGLHAFRHGREVAEWYRGQSRRAAARTGVSCPRSLSGLLKMIQKRFGDTIVAVDVTDELGHRSGWHVHRALVPGVSLQETAARIGSKSRALNGRPHPFA